MEVKYSKNYILRANLAITFGTMCFHHSEEKHEKKLSPGIQKVVTTKCKISVIEKGLTIFSSPFRQVVGRGENYADHPKTVQSI